VADLGAFSFLGTDLTLKIRAASPWPGLPANLKPA
jgi:hypothetical protein